MKSINNLKNPTNIGDKNVFNVSLFTGYEFLKITIINKNKQYCLAVN